MSTQPVADRSVRLAWAAEAETIGEIQARAWRECYGDLLPQEALADIDGEQFAQAWREAITRPPTARHRVLVALDASRVVGFAAVAPSDDPDAAPADGEIVALHVDSAELGNGHGSRLLAAAADTLRADGLTRARMWLAAGDDAVRAFLESAGWAADGAHRSLDVDGDGRATLRQVRLHTDVSEEGS